MVGYVCSEQDPKPLAKVCVGRCCRTVQDKPEFHVAFDVVPVHRPCLLLLSPVASFGADSDADVAGLCCTLANHALNTASLISPRHHEGFSDPLGHYDLALDPGIMICFPNRGLPCTALKPSGLPSHDNTQVEFQDICLEYGMQARLQHLDSQSVAATEAGSGAGASRSAPSSSDGRVANPPL